MMLGKFQSVTNLYFYLVFLVFISNLCSSEHDGWQSNHGRKSHGRLAKRNHDIKEHRDGYHVNDQWMNYNDNKMKHASEGWKEKRKHTSGANVSGGKGKYKHNLDEAHQVSGEKGKFIKKEAGKEKKKGLKKHWNTGDSELKTFEWNKGKHFEKGQDNAMEKHRESEGHGHKKLKDAQESMKDREDAHLEKGRSSKRGLKEHKKYHDSESEKTKKMMDTKRAEKRSQNNKEYLGSFGHDWSHLEKPGFYRQGHDSDHKYDGFKKVKHFGSHHKMKDDFDEGGKFDLDMPKHMDSVSGLKEYFKDDFGFR